MYNLESVFVKEFRERVRVLGYKDIYKVTLPSCCRNWVVSGSEMYAVKDCSEPYFEVLNNKVVKRVGKNYELKRRIVDPVSRGFKKDENGLYIKESYKVPTGSVAVISPVKLGLPNERKHKPSTGYGYVDFMCSKNRYLYIYIVPKSVLYKINQTALVISVKNMKNFTGIGYKTWNMGEIYIHIIPYNPNSSYVGSRVLKTGYTLDYSKDIECLINHWISSGFIPDIRLCQLQSGENIATKATVVGYPADEYIPISLLPLSDREVFGVEGEVR